MFEIKSVRWREKDARYGKENRKNKGCVVLSKEVQTERVVKRPKNGYTGKVSSILVKNIKKSWVLSRGLMLGELKLVSTSRINRTRRKPAVICM